MKLFMIIGLCFLIVLSGCTNDKPTPEGKAVFAHAKALKQESAEQKHLSMNVRHLIIKNRIYVECFISNFTFSEGNGYLAVSVDGKPIKKVRTAAFVIENVPTGQHRITIELIQNGQSKLIKEWPVFMNGV